MIVLNAIRFALWLLPFGKLKRQLERVLAAWVCRKETAFVSVGFIVRAVQIAARYTPGGAKCLAKALTTQILLNRYGYSHKLCIGVAKGESQQLEAHAWIEYQGRVLVGGLKDLDRFKPLSVTGVKV